jgi:hypothetical protein
MSRMRLISAAAAPTRASVRETALHALRRIRSPRNVDRGDIHIAHLTTDRPRRLGSEHADLSASRRGAPATASSLNLLNDRLSDVQARYSGRGATLQSGANQRPQPRYACRHGFAVLLKPRG